jgi:hypothetical protein
MDRLLMQRSLVALSGLALVLAASGCRERNVRVPPPAHYSDGTAAVPEAGAYPGYAPPSLDPAAIDPYSGTSYGASAGTYDPSTAPTSGTYDPNAGAAYDPYATPAGGASYGDPAASGSPTSYAPAASDGVYASPSSPAMMGAGVNSLGVPGNDPYATGLVPAASSVTDFGSNYAPAPAELPGIDGGVSAPPIPDDLPMMP